MAKRTRLVNPTTKPKRQPVVVVHSEVCQVALRLANYDASRIRVLSETAVLVRNQSTRVG